MISNYPNGFSGGLTLKEVPVVNSHPGKVFWVNNSTVLAEGGIGGSDSNPGTYHKPFSTLDYAIGRCVAHRGDVIYVMPGYTQSMTAADAVDVDVAGVTIIGLGSGTKRPKFTYDNAAGEFVIGAPNVKIENLWFVPSVTAITVAVDVEAVATDAQISNCEFSGAEAAGIDEFNSSILFAAGADRGRVKNCKFDMGEAGAVVAVSYAAGIDQQLEDNYIVGDYSTACVSFTSTAPKACFILRNVLINGVKSGLNTVAAIVGVLAGEMIIGDNLIASDVGTFALMITNFNAGYNLGNRYTDDVGGATTAVDRSASVVVAADA